jgi:BirA family biotin operon repressor/biotin-[acetyl-CoA-carboxylase] ligase
MSNSGEIHKELSSTQETLKALLKSREDLPHLYYVMADVQTAGRGRSDHKWVSLHGNLHVSILLRKLPFTEITWIPLWVSICIQQALGHLGVDKNKIQLKWPNDLWIAHTKKLVGTLCEKIGSSIVVGVGLNLLENPKIDQEPVQFRKYLELYCRQLCCIKF